MLRILLLLCLFSYVHGNDDSSPEVTIQQGKLRGFRLTSRKGREFFAFQRIPYAKPPVGDLRFKSPQPPEKWEGVLDATKDVPRCTQRNLFFQEQEVTGQEDCLFINVYTPQITVNKPLDVMVYIHGGGFIAFSSNDAPPHHFMDQDVVFVNFNYRLGPLGFLSTGDAVCPGNNGLKDQLAALRWVRNNIAAFGGNPKSVTIFGESAGGASVHHHVLSPASRGLFDRAVAQSGTAFAPWAFTPCTRHHTKKLANLLDCPIETSTTIIDCLRKKDAAEITGTDGSFMEWGMHPLIPFKPVLEKGEEAFIPATPLELAKNLTNPVPLVTGITNAEGAMMAAGMFVLNVVPDFDKNFETLAPLTMLFQNSPQKAELTKRIRKFYFGEKSIMDNPSSALVDLYTDSAFVHGADQFVRIHSEVGSAPVYYYYLTYRGSRSYTTIFGDPITDYGVCHADDLIYLFPSDTVFAGTTYTKDDEEMIDTLTTLWANFAHSGNPTPTPFKGVTWPQVSNPSNSEYAEIALDGLHVKQGLLKERVKFWDSLPLGSQSAASEKDEL